MLKLEHKRVTEIIQDALNEDIGDADVTSLAMNIGVDADAIIVSKQSGIVSGSDIGRQVFEAYDPSLKINILKKDGDPVNPGDTILEVKGKGQSILSAERTALNLMARLSGIASFTNRFTEKIKDVECKILDTRKTIPNIRILDKYAVRCGGGTNHRMGLYDMILIKENHIRWCGSLEKALKSGVSYANSHNLKIEVEVTNFEELETALAYRVDYVMLDHFSLPDIKKAVKMNKTDCKLEASGNVTLDSVRDIALTGVDFISIGALTHSVPSFDFSLLFM